MAARPVGVSGPGPAGVRPRGGEVVVSSPASDPYRLRAAEPEAYAVAHVAARPSGCRGAV
ncbi:hypothetical protein [Streptomyces bluensis]|uniref:Uncharacterized protein n=1 Tax=Streptomyces bluensis TaxID=33897 RepID=A0ABW6UUH3_9ACTN|nr:hypothetical protein [Streptomyces bluensis]